MELERDIAEVLLVGHEAAISSLVRLDLEGRDVPVTSSPSVAAALEALRGAAFGVVVLDLSLPDGSGFEVLAHLQLTAATTHVIVLGDASTEADRIDALERGADDYLVKPCFAGELTARVLAAQRRRRVIRDALLDPSRPRRDRIPDTSAQLRSLVTGIASEVTDAVIVTDLRGQIRSWNHAAVRLYGWAEAEVLGRRIVDVAGWIGDDDFDTSRRSLASTDHWHGEGRQPTRDGSLVAVRAAATLLRDEAGAPMAVVTVNRPIVAADLDEPVVDEADAAAVEDLRRGLASDELVVFYQPVVALADRTVLTVEALVRWQHPQRGLLRPDAFIDVAERSGLIIELGTFVLEAASRQVAAWRAAGVDINVAVNISARELAEPDLAARVDQAVSDAGLDHESLWLEVTETALIEDVDRASTTLHRLAGLGVGISIDDFGTGWASLTYLRNFPIDVLKIDRTFVTDIDRNPSDAAIARSILTLGSELGHAVVAEGIETVAQQDALRALGCTMGQGYLYGKPTPADEVPLDRARRRPATGG